MQEKELRLALVCYGGVSLAVYMHGVVKEAWKLLRASRAFQASDNSMPADSEAVYLDLLRTLAAHLDLRVLIDIVAGASAGGINGVQLAHAIAGGHDMEPLRDLWLDCADVDVLLDPAAAPKSGFAKLYAQPLVWFAGRERTAENIDRVADPGARAEVRAKLSRFVRSRWFEPPFSGSGFARLIYDSLAAMEQGVPSEPLLPPRQPLDLFVTVTDFNGYPEKLALHSPPEIFETEHRVVIGFHNSAAGTRTLASRASLAFAARASASFPGAFPPAQVSEMDAVLAEIGDAWPDRSAFLARALPRHIAAGIDPATVSLVDGSVLNNAPFGPAIEALRNRPAHREVDRRFVYIDPKPGRRLIELPSGMPTPPGFFTTILRSLSDIPREQPIRDSVEAISDLSRRVRRLRHIVAALRPAVDAAIERELGRTLFFYRATRERLADWRGRVQTRAAAEAGFAYAAYAHLKLSHVVEWVVVALDPRGEQLQLRDAVWRWVRASGIDDVTHPDYVAFLRRFDLQYRIRRLRFLIRRMSELIAAAPRVTRPPLETVKAALYELLAPLLDRRMPSFAAGKLAPLDGPVSTALAAFDSALDLAGIDTATDAGLTALLNAPDLPKEARRGLLLAYLGFPFFDIATLPLLQGEGLDEFDEIRVDRISPADATALGTASLKGMQFNGFGAFFARSWREHDYLWGRLHAAERLIDIVASALPVDDRPAAADLAALKSRAFRAILLAEKPHLTHVTQMIQQLEAMVDAVPSPSAG